MREHAGQQLGNYQLIQLLGQGRWAAVYLGEHLHLRTQAAIKVLHGPWTASEVEGFLSEARTLASLRHPQIVRVLDFGVQEGTPFLVMEYAPGGTLRQLHPKGMRLPLETVVSYIKQVASALQYAHDQRLIHRDLKPENLLLGHGQQVWLSDFGLALVAHSVRSQSFQQTAGTLAYMAPEQLQGHPTPASDQYALGVVAYEWLAGERPFSGAYTEVAVQHTLASPPSLCEKVPTLTSAVEHVVFRALAKDPSARFPTVEAFARALEEASREDGSGRTVLAPAAEHLADPARRSSSHGLPTGTVTLLFSDIEGSTRLLQQMGDRYADVLAVCRHLLRAAFQQRNGYEVDTQGDAFFVAFARATDAISAAVAAQRALASHSWPEGVTVRVRMGMHTGEPQLYAEGYVGLDVHHAARIMSAGHGGQVLLSQTTRDLVEQALPEDVHLRDLGAHRLKDLQSPTHFFQLVITGLPAHFPPLQTLDASPNNLPVQPTPFIGREKEVAAVTALLGRADVRLLTLTGPGGTGKTRMALQVAAELSDRFADGVFFVNLASISEPEFVVPTIAQALEVRETGDQSPPDLLKAYLREKQLLLLLDNFEQVVSAAVQVAALLAACPKLKVLVTSRMVLHVQAEHEFAVPPLAVPDPKHLPDLLALSQYEAVALFILRAQAVKSEFQVNAANAPALAEICARLDGLPLAIELAAARTNVLPPQALLARLGQRLAVLTSGARDAPARQQTLRKTIEWSYQLLDVDEQRLFRRLSVFVGGCTLAAIEAVCAAPQNETTAVPVLDALALLVDKSLLQQREQAGGEPRYVMLETIREYALEALEGAGKGEVTRRAHAAYYLRFAEEAFLGFSSPQQAAWWEHLEWEHGNLRAALQWLLEHGEVEQNREMALRLAGALGDFWRMRGHGSEGQHFLERALAAREGVAASVQAKVLRAAGRMALYLNNYERAEVLCEESLALCRELGDTQGLAHSLHLLAWAARERNNVTRASSLFEEALALRRKLGNKEDIAWSLLQWGILICRQGEYARASAFFEESLAIFREIAHPHAIGWSLYRLAEVRFLSHSDPATVGSLLAESLSLFRVVGEKSGITDYFYLSGRLALSQGDAPTAHLLAEQGLAISREIGVVESKLLSLLGEVAAHQGDHATARALYEESLTLASRVGHKVEIASCLEGLAEVVAAQGDPAWAARLWGTAEALREAIGAPLPAVERADYERSLASARARLGEQAFASAWAEGRALTPEHALATPGPVALPGGAKSVSHAAPSSRITPPTPTYPDGLTAREVEVLRLVAQGLTNAQIAERLIISPTTVNAHMRSLYSKVAVNTRIALMRYATEHHLT